MRISIMLDGTINAQSVLNLPIQAKGVQTYAKPARRIASLKIA